MTSENNPRQMPFNFCDENVFDQFLTIVYLFLILEV